MHAMSSYWIGAKFLCLQNSFVYKNCSETEIYFKLWIFRSWIYTFDISLQNKDEKIMSLEAENAVLHLRMSKLMHQLQIQAEKISFLSSRIQDQLKERRQWKGSVFSLYTKFLVVVLLFPLAHFQNFECFLLKLITRGLNNPFLLLLGKYNWLLF